MNTQLSTPDSLAGRPAPAAIQPLLEELHRRYLPLREGTLAGYIPELRKADPDWFGICIATTEGQLCQVGDYQQPFTLQSVSKPFMYGLALEDHGRDSVLSRIGVEPTGDAFNAIILDEHSNRPYNPMVNAGAIAIAGLIKGADSTERLNRMLDTIGRYTGHRPLVDIAVFTSERTSGHRNRAIAYLMRNFNMLDGDIDSILDLYFQQCALLVTCQDLAVMAATLANGGVNPITGKRALASDYVKDVLSVMYTCGMYDFAGEWAYRVGLPAKSGVGGGLLAIAPQKFGIGVFSPLLDAHGHSLRAVKVCEELSARLGLHIFGCAVDPE